MFSLMVDIFKNIGDGMTYTNSYLIGQDNAIGPIQIFDKKMFAKYRTKQIKATETKNISIVTAAWYKVVCF